jgi:hypothetical protein
MLQRARIGAQKQHHPCVNKNAFFNPVVTSNSCVGKYDGRYDERIVRFHMKILWPCSSGCYDASVGFSVATQGRIGIASSE